MDEEADEWEMPDEYWQILTTGGFVHDLSTADYKANEGMLRSNSSNFLELDDLYGESMILRPMFIETIVLWTKRGGQRHLRSRKPSYGQE